MKLTIPEKEILNPGHLACQGCGAALAMRYALKALGRKTIIVLPACCWTVIDGPFPYSSAGVPLFHTAFETAASCGAGVNAALEVKGKNEVTVLSWAGDGGTMDIGIQALSGAAERGDNLIYVCYDNEAYMNTGIQRSSSTPHGSWTSTTPVKAFKKGPKKNMIEIMAAHKIPYSVSASISHPEDFIAKLQIAKQLKGVKFMQILSPCPAGWKYPSNLTVKIAKLAIETCIFPLYEVKQGRYKVKKPANKKPVSEYLKLQGRFRHLTGEEIDEIQKNTDQVWKELLKKEKVFG
ncbi:MAG: 3-methyl-2-oxobutanoate dehydrogenase subunit beta [Candidatus Omnitrophota bacterium]|nr:3-methyl-2-oxobutanoate dehydrogenase subunit beta [Candidatus Omnitrophota bacterium]